MKRMSFLPMGAVVLLLAFTACSEELNEVPSGTLKQIVMTAADFETEDGSRTNFQITSAGAEFSWAANDTVGIFPNEGAQAYFPMTSGAGTKSANFTGGGWALKDASTYAAYYPFIGDFYLNKNAIPVDFSGQVQTGDASTAHLGAYDYMAAIPATPKNGNVSFAFKHLGALVQLKLTVPKATTLNSVTLITENNAFAVNGTVDVMASAPSITSVTSAKEVTLELKELATTEANQVVTLYMMLPPVDLSAKNLKAVVKTSNGTEEVTLGSKNFQAGKAYALSGSLKDPNGGAVVGNGTYKDGVVSIATAGTMKKLLGDDYLNITSLKIVGPINGDDIYYLRKMLGGNNFSEADWGKLTSLDLSEATIVEGDEWYYEDNKKYYTLNDVIGENMFCECNNVQKITLPNNVTSIGEYAFYACGALTDITIPDSVVSIGENAFWRCDALTKVTIGNGVTSIGEYAFYQCDGLTDITIPNSVVSIGEMAFAFCDALTKVTIGNGVTSIGGQAFTFCKILTEVTIGNNDVTSIGNHAFYACDALTKVTIKDLSSWCKIKFSDSSSNPLSNGARLFLNDKEITQLVIPDGVLEIRNYAFYNCDNITKVTILDGVTLIGEYAFSLCNVLNEVSIGDGITSIGEYAFNDCNVLTEVSIGKSVTEISPFAFSGCSIMNFYCYAVTPPSLEYWDLSFNSIDEEAKLYVPEKCGTVYKKATGWRFFKNIIEMD